MTRFWHRRSSEAILLVLATLLGIFVWTYTSHQALTNALAFSVFNAGVVGCAMIVVALSYFFVPLRYLRVSAAINYAFLLIALAIIIIQTGGMSSDYFPLLVGVFGFAGFFGLGGIVAATTAFASLAIQQYISGTLAEEGLVSLALLCAVPLGASFIVWGRAPKVEETETKDDRSYHELASELSQVAGKSEIVITAIGDGVVALDGRGAIELINPAAERLLGWERHDAMSLSYKSVLQMRNTKDHEVDEQNDPIAKVLTTNKSLKTDMFSLVTHSGKKFLASISVNPVGQVGQGVIVVFRDITTEKSDERQRAEFISTASHEMRTPVASIEGYLGLALNPATASIDPKAREYITKAHESAQHLGRLFADLLDVSKADDSRLKNDPKIVDIVPFVHDIVQGLTPNATEKGLRVLYKPLPSDIPPALDLARNKLNPVFYANVDNDHLREVIQNLVENAIKYTPRGEVTVDVTGNDNRITISVADSGIGIPREDQGHLFQKFYRVDNSDTREIGGTGLGLYLCRRLTETIGGRIWVESEHKRGSTFFVEIPRIDHDEAQRLIEQASLTAESSGEQVQATPLQPEPVVTPTIQVPEGNSAPPAPAQPTPVATPASAPQAVTPPTAAVPSPTPPPPVAPPQRANNGITVPPR